MSKLLPNTILNRNQYRIKSVIGQGGFGITYLAEEIGYYRQTGYGEEYRSNSNPDIVVIKELFYKDYCDRDDKTGLVSISNNDKKIEFQKLVKNQIDEGWTIRSLDHPNIVRTRDIFEENNTAYMVMDYVDSTDLEDMLKKGRLPKEKALKYILETLDAVDYFHNKIERRILHLDITPSNILINKKDDKAILIDFGAALSYDSSSNSVQSRTSQMVTGRKRYYSPNEQGDIDQLKKFDATFDTYAVGATLYHLLSGEYPQLSNMLSSGREEFIPPSKHAPDNRISDFLDEIIRKAMAPMFRDRYSTATEFIRDLKREAEYIAEIKSIEALIQTKNYQKANDLLKLAELKFLSTPSILKFREKIKKNQNSKEEIIRDRISLIEKIIESEDFPRAYLYLNNFKNEFGETNEYLQVFKQLTRKEKEGKKDLGDTEIIPSKRKDTKRTESDNPKSYQVEKDETAILSSVKEDETEILASKEIEKNDWSYVLNKQTIEAVDDYLMKYKTGAYFYHEAVQLKKTIQAEQLKMEFKNAMQLNTLQSLTSFLKKYPDSPFEAEVRRQIEKLEWKLAEKENSIVRYVQYIDKYPQGAFVVLANKSIQKIKEAEEDAFWKNTLQSGSIDSFKKYIANYQKNGRYIHEAEIKIEKAIWNSSCKENTLASYSNYLAKYPNGRFKTDADSKIVAIKEKLRIAEENFWLKIQAAPSLKNLNEYLSVYKNPIHGNEAKQLLGKFKAVKRRKIKRFMLGIVVAIVFTILLVIVIPTESDYFDKACKADSIEAYEIFLSRYPSSSYNDYCYIRIYSIAQLTSIDKVQEMLDKYPGQSGSANAEQFLRKHYATQFELELDQAIKSRVHALSMFYNTDINMIYDYKPGVDTLILVTNNIAEFTNNKYLSEDCKLKADEFINGVFNEVGIRKNAIQNDLKLGHNIYLKNKLLQLERFEKETKKY